MFANFHCLMSNYILIKFQAILFSRSGEEVQSSLNTQTFMKKMGKKVAATPGCENKHYLTPRWPYVQYLSNWPSSSWDRKDFFFKKKIKKFIKNRKVIASSYPSQTWQIFDKFVVIFKCILYDFMKNNYYRWQKTLKLEKKES